MRILKYFSILSICAVVIALLLGGFMLRSIAHNGFLNYFIRESSANLSTVFINTVLNKYNKTFNSLHKKDPSKWQYAPEFKKFHDESIRFLANHRFVIDITLYTADLEKFFSSSGHTFATLIKNTEDYTSVIEGRSLVLGPYSIQVNNKTSKKEYVLTALLPIFDSSNENINYVIAITYEVTKAYWFINVVCIALTLCCLVVAILVYILMLYRSIQHSKLLSKQYEINSILEDAKQKAEEDSIRKSNFFANLSHELRTPLNAIIGFSKIIHEESMGSLGNSQYKEYAKDINISGEHLLSLINDILDFAKADSGKLEVSLSPLDVTKLAKSSLRMMMPRAEEVNVKLVEKIAQKNMLIQANSKRLKQVMLNLLSNAVKFAPAGEKVVLHLYYEKDNIIIQVQDTGIGIDQKDIASVMSAYGQVDNKSFREHEGTGLGLPLTKKLVELMKGKFNIKSEPGLGTTITLTFKAEHIDFNELTENQEHEKSDF